MCNDPQASHPDHLPRGKHDTIAAARSGFIIIIVKLTKICNNLFQKRRAIIPLVPRYPGPYWAGARIIENNNQYVFKWVATSSVLPNNSNLWGNGENIPLQNSQFHCVRWNFENWLFVNVPCNLTYQSVCEDTSATTTTEVQCDFGFYKTTKGCFHVELLNLKNWTDAEAACQEFGSCVHLATLDTVEVSTFMLYIAEQLMESSLWFHDSIMTID